MRMLLRTNRPSTPEDSAWRIEGRIALQPGELLRVRDGRGWTIAVIEGEVWITQDGDFRDIVIESGDQFRLGRAGLSLVHAMRRSSITLLVPLPEHRAPRVDRIPPRRTPYWGSIFASST
jgi:hypothetical protein